MLVNVSISRKCLFCLYIYEHVINMTSLINVIKLQGWIRCFASTLFVTILVITRNCCFCLITPHAQRERGQSDRVGVHIYYTLCLWTKKIESYFSDRLNFSNIQGGTSRRICRLALPLLSLETLSSSSKSRISYIMHTMLYLSRRMTQLPTRVSNPYIYI